MRTPPAALVDLAGTGAAIACAIHCALPAFFALISPWIAFDAWGEWIFPLLSTVLGGCATIPTWARTGNPVPLLLWIIGLAMVVATRLVEGAAPHDVPTPLLVGSGVVLAGAHFANHRIRGRSPQGLHRRDIASTETPSWYS